MRSVTSVAKDKWTNNKTTDITDTIRFANRHRRIEWLHNVTDDVT